MPVWGKVKTLLTQVSLCYMYIKCVLIITRAPVPSLVPVSLASEVILAIFPPAVAVLLAQGHIHDALLTPALICLHTHWKEEIG